MKDLGNASYVIGIQIIRDINKRQHALSQASYIDKVIERISMWNSKKGYAHPTWNSPLVVAVS